MRLRRIWEEINSFPQNRNQETEVIIFLATKTRRILQDLLELQTTWATAKNQCNFKDKIQEVKVFHAYQETHSNSYSHIKLSLQALKKLFEMLLS